MGLLGKREPERSRDITVALRNGERPADDIESELRAIVADEYGKRKPQRQVEDIVLANEYIAFVQHLDDTVDMLRKRFDEAVGEAESLKATLQERVVSLKRRVDYDKRVVEAYRNEFVGIHARATEMIDAEDNPGVRNSGGTSVDRSSGTCEVHEIVEAQPPDPDSHGG